MSNQLRRLHGYLMRTLRETCARYELLTPGDRVGVAVSGGKDSATLLVLLQELVRTLPFSVDLMALHLDQRQPGYDGRPLVRWLDERRVGYEILSEDTYSVVVSKVGPGETYCSLCSRLRRGVLYTALERLRLNKLALGHHRDDGIETLLMNLFYAGRMQAMPAKYTTDDGRHEVIRPLIECAEHSIREYAELCDFPILPCNLCGSQPGLRRDRMKQLVDELEREHPNVRSVIANAIANVRPTHLLDADVARAWRERAPDLRPASEPAPSVKRMSALPLATSS
ncbi:MAG TPA: tRNA 2-thiocytidine(32) synthetase TtcA, partial [Polyangiaceae bacterium]|nr:tRNA 2-thiocytidine(32) synthetase TtcA [Polyangiaceae bacterium]